MAQVAYEAALQGMVLLKNTPGGKGLPLVAAGLKLAVVGPLGNTHAGLQSDYEGAGDDSEDTIFMALQRQNKQGSTAFAEGVPVTGTAANDTTAAALAASICIGISQSLLTCFCAGNVRKKFMTEIPVFLYVFVQAVEAADVIVLAIGLMKAQEHEGMDRKDTLLPSGQEAFAQQVFKAAGGKRFPSMVIVILCNGGAVSIDDLIAPSSVIIEAFNPVRMNTGMTQSLSNIF